MTKPQVILLTGHICSGKSSLLLDPLFSCYTSIDIANFSKDHKGYIEFLKAIFNSLFQGKRIIVELLGNEEFFSHLRDLLFKSTFTFLEIELKKASLEMAIKDLEKRNHSLNKIDKLNEAMGLRTMYNIRFNPHAYLFLTTSSGIQNFDELKLLIEGVS